jgi:Ca-activated chloride channel family protein
MYAPWNSNIKIEVAKKVMGEFLDSLKNLPNLELALRCYGHTTFFKPDRNCKDSKLEVPFADATINSLKIKSFIAGLDSEFFKTFAIFFKRNRPFYSFV